MRREFKEELYQHMLKDDRIIVVTGDLGYGMFDKIREDFPDRFINTGAAEQSMMGIAVGLALQGKIPVVYSITPFLLYRPFETIRTYINHESIPVIMIGGGRNKDYEHDGISHDASDDKIFMQHFKNIESRWPDRVEDMKSIVKEAITSEKPYYINLTR